ncbi:MAG: hypothetical protein WDA03_08445 [Trueperaceae bacterium]
MSRTKPVTIEDLRCALQAVQEAERRWDAAQAALEAANHELGRATAALEDALLAYPNPGALVIDGHVITSDPRDGLRITQAVTA